VIKRKFFIHCYITDGWRQIYDEIISSIPKINSEIISVISGSSIPDGVVNPVLLNSVERTRWEFPTLKLLRNDCLSDGNESIDYYYMHLKGVTNRSAQPYTEHWRKMMLYFLTRDVEQNSILLDKYDALGCNFCPNNHVGNGTHFSGNFWVTRRKHVINLEDLDCTMFRYGGGRLGAEFWIGQRESVGKYFSFHQSGVNHYSSLYAPDRYMGTSTFSEYGV
jgi:hypothetical protein